MKVRTIGLFFTLLAVVAGLVFAGTRWLRAQSPAVAQTPMATEPSIALLPGLPSAFGLPSVFESPLSNPQVFPTPTPLPDRGTHVTEIREFAVSPAASSLYPIPRLVDPATDGKTLVGVVETGEDTHAVFAIDLSSGKVQSLYEGQEYPQEPDVSGRYVVWTAQSQLHFYDLSNGNSGQLGSGIVRRPHISGNTIVWERGAGMLSAEVDIGGYDLSKGEDFFAAARPGVAEGLPDISGEWVVYLTPAGSFTAANLWATNTRTWENIHIAEILLQYRDEQYLNSVYAIDAPWVAWAAPTELHFYNLDSHTAYTVPVEACVHSYTASWGDVITERQKPADLALAGNTLIFACGQWMGYDMDRNVFFSIPIYPPGAYELRPGFEGWAIFGDRVMWVLSYGPWGQEESHIYTSRIERGPLSNPAPFARSNSASVSILPTPTPLPTFTPVPPPTSTPPPTATPLPTFTPTPTPIPWEFTLPVPTETAGDWPTFAGVGSTLRYPPGWSGQPYAAQGGVRDGATYEFVWTDAQGLAARIEVLEIVNPDTGLQAMETEMFAWQGYQERGYTLEPVTVQGHPAWWMRAMGPPDVTGLAGALWLNGGERVYRVFLRCRSEVRDESEHLLRQMLSTLAVTEIDWSRQAEPPPPLPSEAFPTETPTP